MRSRRAALTATPADRCQVRRGCDWLRVLQGEMGLALRLLEMKHERARQRDLSNTRCVAARQVRQAKLGIEAARHRVCSEHPSRPSPPPCATTFGDNSSAAPLFARASDTLVHKLQVHCYIQHQLLFVSYTLLQRRWRDKRDCRPRQSASGPLGAREPHSSSATTSAIDHSGLGSHCTPTTLITRSRRAHQD